MGTEKHHIENERQEGEGETKKGEIEKYEMMRGLDCKSEKGKIV